MSAKKVAIVAKGDPENSRANYHKIACGLRDHIRAWGNCYYEIGIFDSIDDAIAFVQEERGTVVFVSAYFCDEALRLARKYTSMAHFLVYSVGMAPVGFPQFAFGGVMNEKNLDHFF